MAYEIGQAHKPGKQDRKRLDNTTDHSSEPSTPSYSYSRLNENADSNTTVVLLPCFDTSIKTQHKIASDASVGENNIAPSILDQITNHNGNTYDNDNDDSQSYETPQKDAVLPLLTTQSPPQPHHDFPHCLHLENNIYVFKFKGTLPM